MPLDELRVLADVLGNIPGTQEVPWAYQDTVVTSPVRHVIERAARRVGKSKRAAKRAFVKKILQSNSRGWIVGPSYDLAHKEFRYILEFVRTFCRINGLPQPEPVRENPGSGDLYLRTSWGAEVIGKSAQKAETLVGEELDWVIMSEAALHKRETWERYVRPTLTTRKGISIWPFTPDAGGLWLYELELEAQSNPEWQVFTCPAWECPHYDPKEIEDAKRELSEDAFYEQYGGEWRFYTGRVYKMVRPDVHVVEPFAIPSTWRVLSGLDFGYRDPTASLYLAVSPTGEGYFCAEYYRSEETMSKHARALLELEGQLKIRPQCRVADHHGLGNQLILEASQHGLKSVACRSNDRRARRDRMITAFTPKPRPAPYHLRESGAGAEGTYPDLFIMKGRCPDLQREIQFLRFKETSRREGSMGDCEGDDHAIDAAEYVVEYAQLGQSVRSRRPRSVGAPRPVQPAFALTGY